MDRTVALIDGDAILYFAFGYKPFLEEEVSYIKETGTLQKDAMDRYVESGFDSFLSICNHIVDHAFADQALIAVGPELPSFRHAIYPEYKANRKKSRTHTNMLVPELRRILVENEIAIPATHREADDLLRIWHTQAVSAGDNPVICAQDKDLLMIPGVHCRIVAGKSGFTLNLREVTEEEAMRAYYTQLLTGDSVDNIPGIPQIGAVRAASILLDRITEDELQSEVIYQYMLKYQKAWKEQLMLNGTLIHLQRHPTDLFTLSGWKHPAGHYIT
jgi:5'-3' exonuclease